MLLCSVATARRQPETSIDVLRAWAIVPDKAFLHIGLGSFSYLGRLAFGALYRFCCVRVLCRAPPL